LYFPFSDKINGCTVGHGSKTRASSSELGPTADGVLFFCKRIDRRELLITQFYLDKADHRQLPTGVRTKHVQ